MNILKRNSVLNVMLHFFLAFLYFRSCILVPFFPMWYFYAFWSEDCCLMGQWMEFVTCSPLRYVLNFCLQGIKVSVAIWPFMNALISAYCFHRTFGCISVCLNCKTFVDLSGTIPSPKVQRLKVFQGSVELPLLGEGSCSYTPLLSWTPESAIYRIQEV